MIRTQMTMANNCWSVFWPILEPFHHIAVWLFFASTLIGNKMPYYLRLPQDTISLCIRWKILSLAWIHLVPSITILCLSSRTTVTSDVDACYGASNMWVFITLSKKILRLTHSGGVLQHISFGTFFDVPVVLGMKQSIHTLRWPRTANSTRLPM